MNPLNWKNLFLFSIVLLPFSFALNPTNAIDLPLTRVLFPLIFLFWLTSSFLNKKIILDTRARFWFFTFFLFFCTLSFFWSDEKSLALKKILFLLSFFPVYFLTYTATNDLVLKNKLIKSFVFSSFLVSLFALFLFSLQFILGIDTTIFFATKTALFFLGANFSAVVSEFPSWLVNIGGKTLLRTFGSFPDPHLFSLFVNLSLPFSFYLWKKTTNKFYLWIGLTCLLASLLSFSRASYLAIFLSFLFSLFFFTNPLNLFKKHFSGLLFVSFFFFLFLIIPNPLIERFSSSFNLAEGSNVGRMEMWKLASKTTADNPLFGVGIGNFAKYNFPTSNEKTPIYAHNLFLDFSSEIGIFGATLLLLAILSPLFILRKNSDFLIKAISIASLIFIIHSLFETPFYSVRVFPIFLFILAIKTDA